MYLHMTCYCTIGHISYLGETYQCSQLLAPISQTSLSQCSTLNPVSWLSLTTGSVENVAEVRFHQATKAFAQSNLHNLLAVTYR